MASQWRTLQRLAEHLVFNEAPKLIRQLQQSPTVQRGIQIGIDTIIGATSEPPAEITTGRPVTRTSAATAHRARRLVYSPNLDGRADPGEIVWTWVTYEEDPSRGKDRPVLVVGRDRATQLGQPKHRRILVPTLDGGLGGLGAHVQGTGIVGKALAEIDRAAFAREARHHLEDAGADFGENRIHQAPPATCVAAF